jgi:hypothetical protein
VGKNWMVANIKLSVDRNRDLNRSSKKKTATGPISHYIATDGIPQLPGVPLQAPKKRNKEGKHRTRGNGGEEEEEEEEEEEKEGDKGQVAQQELDKFSADIAMVSRNLTASTSVQFQLAEKMNQRLAGLAGGIQQLARTYATVAAASYAPYAPQTSELVAEQMLSQELPPPEEDRSSDF